MTPFIRYPTPAEYDAPPTREEAWAHACQLIDAASAAFRRADRETRHLPFEEAARERRRLCDLYEVQMRAEKGRAA
jgi:hypothetical protein